MTNSSPIWTPPAVENTAIHKFTTFVAEQTGQQFANYFDLHKFSVEVPEKFWPLLIDFASVRASHWGDTVLAGDSMFSTRWFPEAKLNYADTMLARRDDSKAIVFKAEDRKDASISRAALYDQVSQLRQYLRDQGVTKGDRVAAFIPNNIGAIIAMLATVSLGAIWSSCSPDFGRQGVLDRFGQIEPKVLFTADGYFYNGKTHGSLAKVADFITDLPTVKAIVVFDMIGGPQSDFPENAVRYEDAITPYAPVEIAFEMVEFDHPLFILYSSGTTGVPKAIVHGHGGTLLQHVKEHQLHSNIAEGDQMFYFTTTSWMMWNWLVSGLASGATLLLYDGSPFYPNAQVLWEFADQNNVKFFGTSAKYIEALAKAPYEPKDDFDLGKLEVLASTGSPLSPAGYDFIHASIKPNIHIASISGGTDIISCFVLGVPTLPVYRGEIQAPGLGMATEVWDDDGISVTQARGELVCTRPFPSRPVMFWGDDGGKKYHSAYFERFDNVWAHGDFAEVTEHGGVIIHGRSDAVLNPGGVRIGTAEIYRQVDKVDEVLESIVIGQEWDNDVRVVLFVRLRDGVILDDALRHKIRSVIKTNCTPRHTPAVILTVDDIPRTKSGKIVEIPVRDVVHGRVVKNQEALANPEALAQFENRPELQ